MNNTWRWIFGIIVGLALLGLLFAGRSDRQAYRTAKGMIQQRVYNTQDRIYTVTKIALRAVDLALLMSGDLPANYEKAAEIKQHIEETGYRLTLVADARGDLTVQRMDNAIEQFNTTLEVVDNAAKEADSPAVKSILDRIYGILEGAKEALVEVINNLGQ